MDVKEREDLVGRKKRRRTQTWWCLVISTRLWNECHRMDVQHDLIFGIVLTNVVGVGLPKAGTPEQEAGMICPVAAPAPPGFTS